MTLINALAKAVHRNDDYHLSFLKTNQNARVLSNDINGGRIIFRGARMKYIINDIIVQLVDKLIISSPWNVLQQHSVKILFQYEKYIAHDYHNYIQRIFAFVLLLLCANRV